MIIPALLFSLVLNLFPLQAMFAIIGSVRDTSGEAVASIRVSLLDENYQTVRTVFADNTGRFQFRGLRTGIYFVRVEPAGTPYEEATQRLELQTLSRRASSEEQFMADFVLKRKKVQGQAQEASPGVVFAQTVPPTARSEYERGLNSIKDKKFEAGVESLKKAIEIFPDYYLALELLGTEYVKRGEYDNALPFLTQAIKVNQSARKSLYALGVAHLRSRRSGEAIEWLQKAAAHDPKNPNVYMMLGIAHGNNGSFDESESFFKKAYQLGGGSVADVHLYLAGIYDKQQKYPDAIRELELFLKEADDIKDSTQIRGMIDKLKTKSKASK
jgi:tetratricopeptide (TPR) repeat protein